jgi:hypothetical protein
MWQPGKSGNPGGKTGEYQRCKSLCRDASFAAAQEIIRLSQESDDERVRYMSATWIYERAWGKPKDYDLKEDEAARPRFDPSLLDPKDVPLVRQALMLMQQAIRRAEAQQQSESGAEIIPPQQDESAAP